MNVAGRCVMRGRVEGSGSGTKDVLTKGFGGEIHRSCCYERFLRRMGQEERSDLSASAVSCLPALSISLFLCFS